MYTGYPNNSHHFTYKYTYDYVLPLLGKKCNFKFNINDFILIKNIKEYNNIKYDFSYLLPKNNYLYEITSFEDNITFKGNSESLIFNAEININGYKTGLITEYHKIAPYPHSCFKIINLSLNTNKKIFISGDSQFLPSIIPLLNYFKEIWYYDNRTNPHISFENTYINENFDYVIFELYKYPYNKYILGNLQ